MRLLEIQEEIWVIISGFDGGIKIKNRLLQHGLFQGDKVKIIRAAPLNGPLLVKVNGREVALGRSVAQKIMVEKVE